VPSHPITEKKEGGGGERRDGGESQGASRIVSFHDFCDSSGLQEDDPVSDKNAELDGRGRKEGRKIGVTEP